VISCEPALKEEVVSVAALSVRVSEPRSVVPSRNFTVPLGVPADDDTVAVNLTALCSAAGFELETTIAVEGALP
jgi:hypothetical protein